MTLPPARGTTVILVTHFMDEAENLCDRIGLKSVPHVHNFSRHGQRIEVEGDGPVLALVAAELVKHGIVPLDLRKEQPSLEDVFLKITGWSVVE